MRRSAFWQSPKAVVVASALVLALGGWGFAVAQKASVANPPANIKVAAEVEPSRMGFAPVVKRVLPAVVSVSSTKIVKTSAQGQQMDPFFRQFFGDSFGGQGNIPDEQRSDGLGSGVIVSPEGYILTNNHVVDGATTVSVTLSDKRELKARVVGADARTDIAVIKIDASNLPTVTVGNSDNVQVGDYALAIGNPFGVGKSVTMGIVSATHRSNQGIENQEDFIQTDAAINPGNSGGALVNDRGELIGINTAIIARGSAGNQGIGFAVPVNLARNVMDQLIRSGKVTRAYLGIYPQDVTPSIAKAFGKKEPGGALVADVSANTPASRGGIEKGDIILSVNGNQVGDANELRNTISAMATDAHVNLKVLRSGSERDIAVTLSELPNEEARADRGDNRGGSDSSEEALAGVSVEDLNGQSGRRSGSNNGPTSGVVVTNVKANSAAADAGLQPGDVIQEVNRQPVKNVADFRRAVKSSNEGTLLLVSRDGRSAYIAI